MQMTQVEKTRPIAPSSTDASLLLADKRSLPLPLKSRQRRILTVGDGNFSYSLALLKQHHASQRNDTRVELVATSYDSHDELVTKYPESKHICAQLKKLGATVLHRVDATNIRESLVAAGHAKPKLQFDTVVFNHPHCGEENVRRHQSLLSHFYASAMDVLQVVEVEDEHSGIQLTLAEGQPERWQAVHRALHIGLVLYRQVDDVDNDEQFGVRYERKRHQNGKSFHQVTLYGKKTKQDSTLFIFRRQKSGTDAATATMVVNAVVSGMTCKNKMTTSRKRKAEKELQLEFACTQCERSFKSAQGLRTHVHMMHELEAGGVSMTTLLLCKYCDRTFKKEDARRQHQLAKHGKDPLIKPDWFEPQQSIASTIKSSGESSFFNEKDSVTIAKTTATATGTFEAKTCLICELTFTTRAEFDAHWQKLQPRITVKRICFNCSRTFDEERALRQHQNFCNYKDNPNPIK
ncbi:unnamed protein product [Peronospora belbahrii]|uniref:C2H2-type domain-containing protein n=1 Tax=Peronospora belbahrii TaxID=622444 RepID=A0AAU9KX43_9STRA|nr:unnamed protein product [Peronospora belbahrii]